MNWTRVIEQRAIAIFLPWYNAAHHTTFQVIHHATGGQVPDFRCRDAHGHTLNVEITPYERGRWLGGLSGAPLWTLVEGDVFWWRLAGVLVEYSTELDLLIARRPDAILRDGRLDGSAWNWS